MVSHLCKKKLRVPKEFLVRKKGTLIPKGHVKAKKGRSNYLNPKKGSYVKSMS